MTGHLELEVEPELDPAAFAALLVSSGLAARRPAGDLDRLGRMLKGSDLVLTARSEGELVGIARTVTDSAYCAYLSDLAVAGDRHRRGIGRRLLDETKRRLGDEVMLILIAAPDLAPYYDHIGMSALPDAFCLPRAV